ncbi:PREDICTED: UPF0565 protein C2orf69 homolog [Papilio polytes]|uniref:UPF0565 protein C2orf69 homolog n=1 Tax=Papilio polytes TaxID=76194 RepID=UPI0006761755|nr:PREDICTED: UPF0565 protein C2orf69 homolog [Papilio polytes]
MLLKNEKTLIVLSYFISCIDVLTWQMRPLRLRRVVGLEGRANDVVFCPAPRPVTPPQKLGALVFFGGDVQDYPEIMQAHRDYRNYLKYNLENTARILGHSFPTKHILVVRPSRIEYKSFSCFDNFVPGNSAGVPDHAPTHNALLHLERYKHFSSENFQPWTVVTNIQLYKLSHNISKIIRFELNVCTIKRPGTRSPLWWREGLRLEQCPLTLVGFSKGCVVLNQFIYEFHYANTLTPGDDHMKRLMSRIEAMYWLDGGHAGGKNTWLTARSLLETLTRLNIKIFVHVSPYQVEDEERPWIGREERAFTALLTKLGAQVKRYLHSQPGAPHSLHMHFEVLTAFATHARDDVTTLQ